MSTQSTNWRIVVSADSKAARAEIAALAKTARAAGMSMEQMFSNTKTPYVARNLGNVGRELNKMNVALDRGNVKFKDFNRYWQNSNNLVRYSKQLHGAHAITLEKTNGAMTQTTAVMKKFSAQQVGMIDKIGLMNNVFRSASMNAINLAKNMQWSGRQIMVGFGVPFAMAMMGASKAFLDVEKQTIRFRKVFNEEINSMSVDEAEKRVVKLANNMSTSLGIVRAEILDTAATFAQMGYETSEIERLTKATTELAMLGEINAAGATDLLRAYSASGFKDDFKGPIDEFEDYVKNMLNSIENSTGLTISAMASHMAQLVPLFSQFGLGMGEGESVLAGMTEALGGNSGEAVTALKAIMQRFYDESKETNEQFASIGVNIDDLQNTYKTDIVGGIAELGRILESNPMLQEDNVAVAETFGNLFGVRQANRAIAGMRAVATGFNDAGKAANDYGRGIKSIEDPQKSAARAANELAEQAESMGGRLRRLKESILIDAAEVGESFLKLAMPWIEKIADVVKGIANLSDGMKKFAIGASLAVVALAGGLTFIGVLGQAALYGLRILSKFVPASKIMTDEMLGQKIATDHVNESLKHNRHVIESLVPAFTVLSMAQRGAAASVNELTTAIRLQNGIAVTPGVTKLAEGHYRNQATPSRARAHGPSRADYTAPTSDRWNSLWGDEEARSKQAQAEKQKVQTRIDNYRTQEMIRKVDERRAMPVGAVHSRGEKGWGRELVMGNAAQGDARRRARIERINARQDSPRSTSWRKGVGTAGTLGMMGGMFMPGKAGDAMMGAGMGMQALTMLGAPKLLDRADKYSKKMAEVAISAKGGAKSWAGAKSSLAAMASSGPVLAIAAAAVAASAYLVKKHIREAREEANLLRNEFTYSSEIADELGLSLTQSKFSISGEVDEESVEDMSDAMKSLNADIDKLRGTEGGAPKIQAIFRNLSREWLDGGATIDQINEKLSSLEAELNVEIEEMSLERLKSTLTDDMKAAIEDAFATANIDKSFLQSLFTAGVDLDAQSDAAAKSLGGALAASVKGVMDQPTIAAISNLKDITGTYDSLLKNDRSMYDADGNPVDENLIKEWNKSVATEVGTRLGITPEELANMETYTEVLQYSVSNILTDYEKMASLTEIERENVRAIGEEWGLVPTYIRAAGTTVEGLAESAQRGQFAVNLLQGDLGNIGKETLDMSYDVKQAFADMDTGELISLRDKARAMSWEVGKSADEVRMLNSMVDILDQHLSKNFVMTIQVDVERMARADKTIDGWMAGSAPDELKKRRGAFDAAEAAVEAAKPAADAVEPIAEAAEENVKSYVSNFRSAMDAKREEVINSILESYDKATEGIIEGIERQRDAEVKSLNERKEAIEEYLDEHAKIQDALDKEIELIDALASGDYAKAAQLQNAARFTGIEDAAKKTIEGIDKELDETDKAYDNRIKREEELRKVKRKNLEESMNGLRQMFIGSMADWSNFYNLATGKATAAGASVNTALRDGFRNAMNDIEKEMKLDDKWENAKFPNLVKSLTDAAASGVGSGMAAGADAGAKAIDAFVAKRMDSFDIRKEREMQYDSNGKPKIKTPTDKPSDYYKAAYNTSANKFHTGGAVGAGPPRDVPAILQTGEFVLQRNAVQALGTDFLSQLNQYHAGGFIGMGQNAGQAALLASMNPMNFVPGAEGSSISGVPGAGDTGRAGWMNNILPGVLSKFRKSLAALPGKQHVTSAYRSPAYNKSIGGAPNSDHTKGKGLDFVDPANRTKSRLNEMGSFFQKQPGVRWVGMPKTDGSGGHNDHVHVSYLHKGGAVGKGGAGRKFKLPNAPSGGSMRTDVSSASVVLNIGDFHGTEDNIDLLVRKVEQAMVKNQRRVNPSRSFS